MVLAAPGHENELTQPRPHLFEGLCNLGLRYVWQTGSGEEGRAASLRAPDPNPQLCVWNLIERDGTESWRWNIDNLRLATSKSKEM